MFFPHVREILKQKSFFFPKYFYGIENIYLFIKIQIMIGLYIIHTDINIFFLKNLSECAILFVEFVKKKKKDNLKR